MCNEWLPHCLGCSKSVNVELFQIGSRIEVIDLVSILPLRCLVSFFWLGQSARTYCRWEHNKIHLSSQGHIDIPTYRHIGTKCIYRRPWLRIRHSRSHLIVERSYLLTQHQNVHAIWFFKILTLCLYNRHSYIVVLSFNAYSKVQIKIASSINLRVDARIT